MDETPQTHGLRPVQQSAEAFTWLSVFDDSSVQDTVMEMGRRVLEIAPETVGLSLSLTESALTFTIMAGGKQAAMVDAMQYLDGGPCIEAVESGDIQSSSDLPTDEGRWQLFAQARGAFGIASTLSLPVLKDDQVIAGVNLYGGTSDAFDGLHEALAEVCGASAAGAVTNADLDFGSRIRAAATPERLLDRMDVDRAAGVAGRTLGLAAVEARSRLHDAAQRAGVSVVEFARFILDLHAGEVDDAR